MKILTDVPSLQMCFTTVHINFPCSQIRGCSYSLRYWTSVLCSNAASRFRWRLHVGSTHQGRASDMSITAFNHVLLCSHCQQIFPGLGEAG